MKLFLLYDSSSCRREKLSSSFLFVIRKLKVIYRPGSSQVLFIEILHRPSALKTKRRGRQRRGGRREERKVERRRGTGAGDGRTDWLLLCWSQLHDVLITYNTMMMMMITTVFRVLSASFNQLVKWVRLFKIFWSNSPNVSFKSTTCSWSSGCVVMNQPDFNED